MTTSERIEEARRDLYNRDTGTVAGNLLAAINAALALLTIVTEQEERITALEATATLTAAQQADSLRKHMEWLGDDPRAI